MRRSTAKTPAEAGTQFIDERLSWPESVGANILLKDITRWTESGGRDSNPGALFFRLPFEWVDVDWTKMAEMSPLSSGMSNCMSSGSA